MTRPLAAVCAASLAAAFASSLPAQTAVQYQKPPAAIAALLDAPPSPVARLSPDRGALAIEQPVGFPTIADMAEPRLQLAGLRFSPRSNNLSRGGYATSLMLQKTTPGAKPMAVKGLPAHLKLQHLQWSPDSKHLAFIQVEDGAAAAGLYLYVVDATMAQARKVGTARLNGIMGAPCTWLSDNESLLCSAVPAKRGPEPQRNPVPDGPVISENLGGISPGRTYEDLLKTPEDERFFEFYATSQLTVVKLNGAARTLPVQGILDEVSGSPDGHFAFVAERHRPFSYALPVEAFPVKYSVVNLQTGAVTQVADEPLADKVPIAADAVETGPRNVTWRADAPATLVWAEAADGGDPRKQMAVHDRLFSLSAPFTGKPEQMLELPMRFSGVTWGNDHLALVAERRRKDRKRVLLLLDPAAKTAKALYEGSSENRYTDPGQPMLTPNAQGKMQLELTKDGTGIYFASLGASSEGDRPFVAIMPIAGGKEQQIWRSQAPFYEQAVALLKDGSLLVQRESVDQQPNYFVTAIGGAPAQLTSFPNPYGTTKLPTKQLLRYKRADGVDLTATLWLPAGYNKADGPLPAMMEAYPAEFKTRSAASEVAGSPYRFPRFGWGGSPVFFAATGYAVLENASIPILGEGKQEPNDTYVEQLVAGAKAAVEAAAATVTVDPKRIAAMGHSYGAFMTANLLAHSDLFCAGIARSGAYNRTLTPFGFQNEERTYWQDPKVYFEMSPFSYAEKIKAPLLMIHGMADDNQGTFPIQSERFFAALKGQGATVRLVFLPLEAHHYDAHESLYHMLWEMNRWLDTYVKTPPAKSATAE